MDTGENTTSSSETDGAELSTAVLWAERPHQHGVTLTELHILRPQQLNQFRHSSYVMRVRKVKWFRFKYSKCKTSSLLIFGFRLDMKTELLSKSPVVVWLISLSPLSLWCRNNRAVSFVVLKPGRLLTFAHPVTSCPCLVFFFIGLQLNAWNNVCWSTT